MPKVVFHKLGQVYEGEVKDNTNLVVRAGIGFWWRSRPAPAPAAPPAVVTRPVRTMTLGPVAGPPARTALTEHRARIKTLEGKREQLEDQISRRSAEFRAQTQTVTITGDNGALGGQTQITFPLTVTSR